jgi:TPR repeat protein
MSFKFLIKSFVALFLLSSFVSSVNANLEDCQLAFENNEYKKAFSYCSESSLYDDSKAKQILAFIFDNGFGGIKENQVLACRLYSELNKSNLCESSKNIDIGIQFSLDKKYDRAIAKLTPFADANYSEAQLYTGYSYYYKDEIETATKWLTKSSENGSREASELLAIMSSMEINPSNDEKDLTKKDSEEINSEPEVIQVKETAIKEAKPNICTLEFEGIDLSECLRFLRTYSISDYSALGGLYEKGSGVDQNYKKAEFWYLQSALEGDLEGQYKLANLYYLGLSGNKNYKESTRWFLKAAESGHTLSQYRLGAIYHYGITGIKTDKKASISWLTKASNKGNKPAASLLNKILNPEPLEMVDETPTESSFLAFFDEVILPKLSFINLVIFLVVVGGINSIIERIKEKRKNKKDLAKLQKKAEEKALNDAKERAQKEIDDLAKIVAEEKAKKAAKKEKKEAEDEAKKAAIKKAKLEFQEKTKKKAEQKAIQDAKDKAKKDAEEKAKKDAEEKAKSLAEVKRAEAAKKAADVRRAERRAEEKAKKDALKADKAKLTALEKAMKDAEAKAKAEQDIKNRRKKEVEEKEGENESQTSKSASIKPKFKFKSKKRFEIINFKTGSEKWFEWRAKGIGSHDAKLICDKKEDILFERKKIKGSHFESFKEIEQRLAKGRALYVEKTGIKVFPLLIQDKRFPWLQASVDGFSEDFTKLLMVGYGEESIKNAQKMKKQSNQSMSLGQVARAQHLLMITGLEEIDYWCYDISGDKTPVLLTIKRDQKKIKQLYELEEKIAEQLNEEEVDNLNKQFTDILKGAGMKF